MEGFKQNPKMQCFKEGGYVTKKEEKREQKEEMKQDIAQDKKIVKKALSKFKINLSAIITHFS